MAPPGAGAGHHINRPRQYNLLYPRRGIMMRFTQSYHTRALVPTPPPAPPAGPSKLNISNNNNLSMIPARAAHDGLEPFVIGRRRQPDDAVAVADRFDASTGESRFN
jgi:hypothetical protein